MEVAWGPGLRSPAVITALWWEKQHVLGSFSQEHPTLYKLLSGMRIVKVSLFPLHK
jgi:hypothetical protein